MRKNRDLWDCFQGDDKTASEKLGITFATKKEMKEILKDE